MENASTTLEVGATINRNAAIQIKRINDNRYNVLRHGEYLASGWDMDEANYIADRIEFDVLFGAQYYDSETVRAKQYKKSMRKVETDEAFHALCAKWQAIVSRARKGDF